MFTIHYLEQGVAKHHDLVDGETSVGRSQSCGLVINHFMLSRKHAVFRVTDGRCTVTDSGSSNGTHLNDMVISEAELYHGDLLTLGPVAIEISESLNDRLTVSDEDVVLDAETAYRPVTDIDGLGGVKATSIDANRLLALLSEIGRTLVDVEGLSDILHRVARLVFASVSAERCFLFLRDNVGDTLAPRVVTSRNGTYPSNASVSRTVLAQVMDKRVAMLARNAQLDSRLHGADSIIAQNVRSFMCAPLWNQREVIGVLYADTQLAERFIEADLDLFIALSNYAAVAIERARLSTHVQEERRRRERLARYHSPKVIDRILEGEADSDSPFIAEERDVSVLFADIVGFTSYSEGRPPNKIAQVLNRCLSCMSDAIFAEEGSIDKFMGDAVLAVFGAPLDQPDHARHAVRAAIGIRSAMASLRYDAEAAPLKIRIAVNSGRAMTGDVGSPKRRDYTVLGDIVNTASRIQSEIADPGQIVITKSTYDQLAADVQTRRLGSVNVRGRIAPVEVYEVNVP